MKRLYVAALALLACPVSAAAPTIRIDDGAQGAAAAKNLPCTGYEALVEDLGTEHGEEQLATMVTAGQRPLTLFVNLATGTWTTVIQLRGERGQIGCVVGVGTGFALLIGEPV